MAIDTRKVTGRRTVHYNHIQDLLADAERLAASNTRTLGNWSQGQVFKHLATVMEGSIDGFSIRAPWFMKLLLKLFKHRILSKPMSPGHRLPPEAEAQIMPGETGTPEGLELLRQAVRRMQTESKRHPSPFLGKLTNEEWDQLHLRHAELHMSFIVKE